MLLGLWVLMSCASGAWADLTFGEPVNLKIGGQFGMAVR